MIKILLILWMVWAANCQFWSTNYDKAFEYQDYTFSFPGDSARTINNFLLSPDESYLYGAADGTNGVDNVNIFKLNIELSIQWSKVLNHSFDPTFAFEIDSSGNSLYMSLVSTECTLTKMLTSDGSISYSIQIFNAFPWNYITLNHNDQYVYGIYVNGRSCFEFEQLLIFTHFMHKIIKFSPIKMSRVLPQF